MLGSFELMTNQVPMNCSQIFVVDSSSSEDDLELAASELHGALSHPSLANMPLLVLANKQDVTGCKKMEEVGYFEKQTC